MPEIKPEQLLLLAGFILPGALSMYVYGLKVPQKDFDLKDRIAEAVCFSLLNFVVVGLPVAFLLGEAVPVYLQWTAVVVGFVILPVIWPFLVIYLLQWAERLGWIAVRARTAWDSFFGGQRSECWVQVEMADGRVMGGRYGPGSYASSWPDPGHLYVEELWLIDDDGYFTEPMPGQPGLLLRPGDYKLIRVYQGVAE
jgi:hypothetical protein